MTLPSLLDSRVPIPLAVAAAVLVWSGRARLSALKLLGLLAGALVIMVVAGHAIGIQNRVGSSFPPSFFVWSALPVFALAVWVTPRRARTGRRWPAFFAAVLFFAFGALEINAHYGYRPTLRDLVGLPLPDQSTHRRPRALAGGQPAQQASAVGATAASPTPAEHGQLTSVDLPGVASHFDARQALVWLPPRWFSFPRPTLPVMVMLGGVPGEPADLIRGAGAVDLADQYAATHGGVAPVVVFADENGGYLSDSECVDGPRGNAETYLTTDVRSEVIDRYGVSPDPKSWGLVGYSEGGTCALTLTLRHPDLFGAFVDISGDLRPNAGSRRGRTVTSLYGGNASDFRDHDPARLVATAHPGRSWLVAGDEDVHARTVQATLALGFHNAGADVEAITEPGGHTFFLARRALEATFAPLADELLQALAPVDTTVAPTEEATASFVP